MGTEGGLPGHCDDRPLSSHQDCPTLLVWAFAANLGNTTDLLCVILPSGLLRQQGLSGKYSILNPFLNSSSSIYLS